MMKFIKSDEIKVGDVISALTPWCNNKIDENNLECVSRIKRTVTHEHCTGPMTTVDVNRVLVLNVMSNNNTGPWTIFIKILSPKNDVCWISIFENEKIVLYAR